jgi:cell division septation protein DedD
MKCSVIAVALFSSLALAQTSLPACGQPCIDEAVPANTDCEVDDLACQCIPANKAAIQTAATSCVVEACGSQAIEVLQAANAICENLPAETAETSAAPSTTTTSAPTETSEAAETTTQSTTAAETSDTSETPEPTTAANTASSASAQPEATNAANTMAAGVGSVFALGFAAFAAF